MYYENLPITFKDDDRGIQYEALASGDVWPAERATGPTYSSGGEPGCAAGCDVQSITIESMAFDGHTGRFQNGKPVKSQWGMAAKLDSADPCFKGFCDEVLEDLTVAIHDAFMEAASGEFESRKAAADDARYEEVRERKFRDRVGIA